MNYLEIFAFRTTPWHHNVIRTPSLTSITSAKRKGGFPYRKNWASKRSCVDCERFKFSFWQIENKARFTFVWQLIRSR